MNNCIYGLIILFTGWLYPFTVFTQNVAFDNPPDWVSKVHADYSRSKASGDGGGYYFLLIDRQDNVETQESYRRIAYRLLNSEGLQQMSDITVDYDPSYQTLRFHHLTIQRGDREIDLLSTHQIRTIQREQSMDRYLYDGTLTAIVNLEDVRIGDVIDYAYTIKGYNPVYEGHYSQKIYFDYSVPYETGYFRVIVPASKNMQIVYRNGEVEPYIKNTNRGKEYLWTLHEVKALLRDWYEPTWYDPYRHVMITDYVGWGEVVEWALKYYRVTSSELENLRSRTEGLIAVSVKKELITEIIRFVQDDIRYIGFEYGINSHKPHGPLKVFDRRFGDCKDKSLLLISLLKLHGIEAYPVLVNSGLRRHVAEELPSINAFDHVVVQINYDGDTFYIDPTIGNQGGMIGEKYFPAYAKGLVLKEGFRELSALPESGISETIEEKIFTLDDIGGDGRLTILTTYKGADADLTRRQFAGTSKEQIQQYYKNYYANLFPGIEVEKELEIVDNRRENIVVVQEDYRLHDVWQSGFDDEEMIYIEFYPQMIGYYTNISEKSRRTAPYYLEYPVSYHHYTRIRLPEKWYVQPEKITITTDYYEYYHFVSYNKNNYEITISHFYKTLSDHIPVWFFMDFLRDHEKITGNLTFYLTYSESWATGFLIIGAIIGFVIWVAIILLIWYLVRSQRNSTTVPMQSTGI